MGVAIVAFPWKATVVTTISVDGAALIAQVLPVLLLIVVVEARGIVRGSEVSFGPLPAWLWVPFVVIVILTSFLAMGICIGSVARNQEIAHPLASIVTWTGLLASLILSLFSLLEIALVPYRRRWLDNRESREHRRSRRQRLRATPGSRFTRREDPRERP
jgi:membrane protein implicated in regulation of membrane protease activity